MINLIPAWHEIDNFPRKWQGHRKLININHIVAIGPCDNPEWREIFVSKTHSLETFHYEQVTCLYVKLATLEKVVKIIQ